MLWSEFFIPTSKEIPADAVVPSHQLMIRAGLIRQVAAGSYSYLPLGYRALRKVERIVRAEMDAAGAIELHMPAMIPLAWFQESGRDVSFGDTLLRIRGTGWREGVALGPTHEEVITEIARAYLNSYKQLPINLYQIQTKFRGEERPKSGVLRTREFLMKDAYSFDADAAGLDASFQRMYEAYCRIFARCGLPYLAVEAESGPIGGSGSNEFMVLTDAGEDVVAISADGQYAANLEKAERAIPPLPPEPPPGQVQPLTEVHTPNCPGIEDVCAFLEVSPQQMIKTLVYTVGSVSAGDEAAAKGRASRLVRESGADAVGAAPVLTEWFDYVVVCVRGDHEVNENKLRRVCQRHELGEPRLADPALALDFAIGYVGPHAVNKLKYPLIIDPDARAVVNAVSGANRPDHHVTGFSWLREVSPEQLARAVVADVRNVVEGDHAPGQPASEATRLSFRKAIEVGHVFKLGTKYSESMHANFLDKNGESQLLVMGCYGIGLNRIMAAAVEAHHDADGIIWPMSIAPFEVLVVALDARDEQVMATARRLHDELAARGVAVLFDDRDQRAGFKFKDADLIGIPLRITVGRKALAEGNVELKARGTAEVRKLPPEAAVGVAVEAVTAGRADG